MKGKKGLTDPHAVPLSSLALAVLDRQKKLQTGDAVFPGMGGSLLNYSTFKTATLRALIDARVPLRNLRIRPANLEDLFLELTGKELRA